MSERVALLMETPRRNTYAVICASRDAARRIAAVSPDECLGIVPIVSRVDAILNDEDD